MDSTNIQFKVNSKCEILIEDKVYKSSIQDLGKDYIGISIPISNGQYAPLNENDKVTVIYYNENNLYGFNTSVMGRKVDIIPIILLKPPKNVKKIQRRKFFRVNLFKDVEYLKVDKNISDITANKLTKDLKAFTKAIMLDLSGGGFRLKTKEAIRATDRFMIKIPLEHEDIFVLSDCIRVFRDTDTNLYVSGFSLFNVDGKVQDKLIAYIFAVMREQMKKS